MSGESFELAMFPLGTVVLPGEVLPLHVFEPRYRALTAAVLEGSREFGIVLIARGPEVGGGDQRVATGTVVRIVEAASFPDGRYALLVRGERPIQIIQWLAELPFPRALVAVTEPTPSPIPAALLDQATVALRRARALCSELGVSIGPWDGTVDPSDPESCAWEMAGLAPLGPYDRQRILEAETPEHRVTMTAALADEVAEDAIRMLSGGDGPN